MNAVAHAERQRALYEGIWGADPEYGTRSRDVYDTVAHRIMPHVRRLGVSLNVVDFGAGDGRFLRELYDYAPVGFYGLGVDVYQPSELPKWLGWRKQVLWEPLDVRAEYVLSTDTLEHMPPEMVPAVLNNIALTASHGFLRISTKQDIYGTERGLHLHETVEPPEWWLARITTAGITPSSWRVYPGHALEVWF